MLHLFIPRKKPRAKPRKPDLPLPEAKELLRRRLELDAPLTGKQAAAMRRYEQQRSVYKETGGQSSHWITSGQADDDEYLANPRDDNRVFFNLGEGCRWAGHGVFMRSRS